MDEVIDGATKILVNAISMINCKELGRTTVL